MKLRNKKTGEIKEYGSVGATTFADGGVLEAFAAYDSLAEMNEEWEDYEEPKELERYSVDTFGNILPTNDVTNFSLWKLRQIGNEFETEEETEKAVEKLEAWKRLKEAGFEFGGWTHTPITKSLTGYNLHIKAYSDKLADYMDDLQLLFGGEE